MRKGRDVSKKIGEVEGSINNHRKLNKIMSLCLMQQHCKRGNIRWICNEKQDASRLIELRESMRVNFEEDRSKIVQLFMQMELQDKSEWKKKCVVGSLGGATSVL